MRLPAALYLVANEAVWKNWDVRNLKDMQDIARKKCGKKSFY